MIRTESDVHILANLSLLKAINSGRTNNILVNTTQMSLSEYLSTYTTKDIPVIEDIISTIIKNTINPSIGIKKSPESLDTTTIVDEYYLFRILEVSSTLKQIIEINESN